MSKKIIVRKKESTQYNAATTYARVPRETRTSKDRCEDRAAELRPAGSIVGLTNCAGSDHFKRFCSDASKFGPNDVFLAVELNKGVFDALCVDVKTNIGDPRFIPLHGDIFKKAAAYYQTKTVKIQTERGLTAVLPPTIGRIGYVHLDICGTAAGLAKEPWFFQGLEWARANQAFHHTWMLDISVAGRRNKESGVEWLHAAILGMFGEAKRYPNTVVTLVKRSSYKDQGPMLNRLYKIERNP